MCYLKHRHSTVFTDSQKLHSIQAYSKRSTGFFTFYIQEHPRPRRIILLQEAFDSSLPFYPAEHIRVCYKIFQRHHTNSSVSRHSRHSSHSSASRIPPHYSILQLECIFYTSAGFHRKLHRVPVENFKTLQTFILQRKGHVALSANCIFLQSKIKKHVCDNSQFPQQLGANS